MTRKWHEPKAAEDQHQVDGWVRFACDCNQVPDLAQIISGRVESQIYQTPWRRRIQQPSPIGGQDSLEPATLAQGIGSGSPGNGNPRDLPRYRRLQIFWERPTPRPGMEGSDDRIAVSNHIGRIPLTGRAWFGGSGSSSCSAVPTRRSAGSPLAKLICFGGGMSSGARSATCTWIRRRSWKKFGRQQCKICNAYPSFCLSKTGTTTWTSVPEPGVVSMVSLTSRRHRIRVP